MKSVFVTERIKIIAQGFIKMDESAKQRLSRLFEKR